MGYMSDTNLAHDTPIGQAGGEQIAYIMYTSGSTGRPKGIAIPQRAINRLVFNTNYIQLREDDCVAFASNTAFDATTFEVWGTLLHGARLVCVDKQTLLSTFDFVTLLRQQKVTTLFLTTALFNQIAREIPDAFRSLRQLLFGGEAVDPQWVRAVLEKGPPQRLLHVYGPTESTTSATWYPVCDVPMAATTVPIGKPVSNTQLFVFDPQQQPVAPGIAGELYIGGDGLAQGYWNRPELTAEKFIKNPFGQGKLYKTGDLVRYLADGNIEFLGRIDQQIKLRGFRIELGEIETVLGQHPAVQQTVVVAREDKAGEKRLVAYVVTKAETEDWRREITGSVENLQSLVSSLRSYLQSKLPDYMIPNAFVQVEQLPLTPNGKIDRAALPAPEQVVDLPRAEVVLPSTPVEEVIATIWQEVLGQSTIRRLGNNKFYVNCPTGRSQFMIYGGSQQRRLPRTLTLSATNCRTKCCRPAVGRFLTSAPAN